MPVHLPNHYHLSPYKSLDERIGENILFLAREAGPCVEPREYSRRGLAQTQRMHDLACW